MIPWILQRLTRNLKILVRTLFNGNNCVYLWITWSDVHVYQRDASQQVSKMTLTHEQISMFSQPAVTSAHGQLWALTPGPYSALSKSRGQLDSCLRNSLTGNHKSTAPTESTVGTEWSVKHRVAAASTHPNHKRNHLRLGVAHKPPGKAEIKCTAACHSYVTAPVS